jgi:hypothetical protein
MGAIRGVVAGGMLALAGTLASAAEPREGGFWWGSASVGAASLKRSYTSTPDTSDTVLALALEFGYAWHPQLLLGVELGGWTLEAGDLWDPAQGEGIRTLYLVARYYPRESSTLFVKGGYGNLDYWNHRPGESGGTGHGGVVGLGKDFPVSGRWQLTPSFEYAWGEVHGATSPPGVTQDQSYRALTLRIGITFR